MVEFNDVMSLDVSFGIHIFQVVIITLMFLILSFIGIYIWHVKHSLGTVWAKLGMFVLIMIGFTAVGVGAFASRKGLEEKRNNIIIQTDFKHFKKTYEKELKEMTHSERNDFWFDYYYDDKEK